RAFDRRSAEILDEFEAEWGWMYKTTDERGRERTIDYTVWSEVLTCPACAGPIVFYEAAFNPRTKRVSDSFQCTNCGAQLTKNRAEMRRVSTRTLLGDTTERIEFVPVAIHYRDGSRKKSKAPDDQDLAVLRRVASASLPGPIPSQPIPFMHMTHERAPLPAKGFSRIHHFWSDRALVALSALWKSASEEHDPQLRAALLFWVEQAIWGLSWMNRFVPTHYSHVNQYLTGVYYVPSQHAEYHPRQSLEGGQAARGKRASL